MPPTASQDASQDASAIDDKIDDQKGEKWFQWTMVGLIAVAIVSIVLATWKVRSAPAAALTALGQSGDFFGGMLNPILTFLTFLALLYTLVLQRTELQESRVQFKRSADALSEQNSQTSFYQALTIHNDVVGAFHMTDPASEVTVHGRDAFRVIYSDIRRIYREKKKKHPSADQTAAILYAFETVYREQPQLAHYFRYLYNTIVMIQRLPKSGEYVKLLRSLLSNHELLVLYYNCAVLPQGKNFIDLAIRHKLFDNMPAHLFEDAHANLLPPEVFGPGGYAAKLASRAPSVRGDLSEPGQPRPPKEARAPKTPSTPKPSSPKPKSPKPTTASKSGPAQAAEDKPITPSKKAGGAATPETSPKRGRPR